MPKLPRVSGKICVAALERLGFTQVRQKGSHVFMRRDTDSCVVPLHKELKTGTLAGVLRQAGLGSSEFISALKAQTQD